MTERLVLAPQAYTYKPTALDNGQRSPRGSSSGPSAAGRSLGSAGDAGSANQSIFLVLLLTLGVCMSLSLR